MHTPLNVSRSIAGQAWRWRYRADDDLAGDDLTAQLLRARGCPPEAIESHRNPTIRGFMPDPAIFNDMDAAAARLADAIAGQQRVVVFGDYDVDGATSAALLIRLLASLGLAADYYIPERRGAGDARRARRAADRDGRLRRASV